MWESRHGLQPRAGAAPGARLEQYSGFAAETRYSGDGAFRGETRAHRHHRHDEDEDDDDDDRFAQSFSRGAVAVAHHRGNPAAGGSASHLPQPSIRHRTEYSSSHHRTSDRNRTSNYAFSSPSVSGHDAGGNRAEEEAPSEAGGSFRGQHTYQGNASSRLEASGSDDEDDDDDEEDFGKFCRRVASRIGLTDVGAAALGVSPAPERDDAVPKGPLSPYDSHPTFAYMSSSVAEEPLSETPKSSVYSGYEKSQSSVDVRVMLTSAEEQHRQQQQQNRHHRDPPSLSASYLSNDQHRNGSSQQLHPPPSYLSEASQQLPDASSSGLIAYQGAIRPASPITSEAAGDTSAHSSTLVLPSNIHNNSSFDAGGWRSQAMGISIETESGQPPEKSTRSRDFVSYTSSLYNIGDATMPSASVASGFSDPTPPPLHPTSLPARQDMGWQSNQLFVSTDGDAEQQSGHDTSFTGGLWDEPLPAMVDAKILEREVSSSRGNSPLREDEGDPEDSGGSPSWMEEGARGGGGGRRQEEGNYYYGETSSPSSPPSAPQQDLADFLHESPLKPRRSPSPPYSSQIEERQSLMDGIAEEEAALEAELDNIDRALLSRVSPTMAKQILSRALPEPQEAFPEEDQPQHRSPQGLLTYQPAWPSSMDVSSSGGPTEYIAGQARSEDMYVPVGAMSPSLMMSPRGSRQQGSLEAPGPYRDLFSALGQHPGSLEAALVKAAAEGGTSSDLQGLMMQGLLGSDEAGREGRIPEEDKEPEEPGPYEWHNGRPRPSRKGREDLDMRVADRLYASAVEAQVRREAKRAAAKEERDKAAMEQCTFAPRVSSYARSSRSKSPVPAPRGVRDPGPPPRSPRPSKKSSTPTSSSRGRSPRPAEQSKKHQQQQQHQRARGGGGGQVIQSTAWEWGATDAGSMAADNGGPPVRGFDPSGRGTFDYESELAASVARAAGLGGGDEGSSAAEELLRALAAHSEHQGAHHSVGRLSELGDLGAGLDAEKAADEALPLRRRPDEPVVTQACHRLYDQALKSRETLQAKRRRAREQEQKLSETTAQALRSRSVSPNILRPGEDYMGSQQQQHGGRINRRPLSAPRRKPEPKGDYSRRSPSPGKNFSEEEFTDFLQRQKKFLVKREEKINSAIEAQVKRKPHPVSEGSKNILRRQEDTAKFVEEELVALGYMKANEYCTRSLNKGSYMRDTVSSNYRTVSPQKIQSSTASFVHRMESALSSPYVSKGSLRRSSSRSPNRAAQQSYGGGSSSPCASSRRNWAGVMDPECTFKPEITKKAAKKQPRSLAEMSQGDWERKEAWRKEKQRERHARELEGVTFSPAINDSIQATSKLCLDDPSEYMEFVEQRNRRRESMIAAQQARRAEEELSGCTFAPRVSPTPPKFIERLARTRAARAAAGMGRQQAAQQPRKWR